MKAIVVGFIVMLLSSCVVKHIMTGPRLTGTCQGACDHYVECKSGAAKADRMRCETECPDVFSDRDSLMAYESLSCKNAVEYVDGTQPQAAKTQKQTGTSAHTPSQ